MPDIASSPATFTVTDAAPTQACTFAIPADTYVSGIWSGAGTTSNVDLLGTGDAAVTNGHTVKFPGVLANAPWTSTVALSVDQLADVNAAAGGNLSVNYTTSVQAIAPPPNGQNAVSYFHLILTGSGGGGGGGGGGVPTPGPDPGGGDTSEGGDTGTGGGGPGAGQIGTEPGGTPPEACDPVDLLIPNYNLAEWLRFAHAGYVDGRYYINYGYWGNVCDLEEGGGWSDPGYSDAGHQISCMKVLRITDRNPIMFMHRGGIQPLQAFSPSMRTGMLYTIGDWPKEVWLGPFDGKGPDRTRNKRIKRLIVWGEYEELHDTLSPTPVLGTVTLETDTGYAESYPIVPYKLMGNYGPLDVRQYPPGILFFVEPPPTYGRVLMAKLVFNRDCVKIRDSMMEYTALEGTPLK